MDKDEAMQICRDELVASVVRGYYTDKDRALKVMMAVAITCNMENDLKVVTEISEDFYGVSETNYRISLV